MISGAVDVPTLSFLKQIDYFGLRVKSKDAPRSPSVARSRIRTEHPNPRELGEIRRPNG
jgi:hypothetical protein